MQRSTVKIPFQPGRRLGLVLMNVAFDSSDSKSDDGVFVIPDAPGSNENCSKAPSEGSSIRGLSLQPEFAAEAKTAETTDHIRLGHHFNTREPLLCLSENSVLFTFAEKLRARSTYFDGALNFDAMMKWGRENVPPIKVEGWGRSISMEQINHESLKFALAGAIMPGDILEKIQYTRGTRASTLRCENKIPAEVALVLRSPESYPIFITLKRQVPVLSTPPRKRSKKSSAIHGSSLGGEEGGAKESERASSSEMGVSEAELGPLYNDIKRKLESNTRDEQTFYGHLKCFFGRKMWDGGRVSLSDFNKIKHFIGRFESNVKLLDDKGNDYSDICVYGGFIKLITKECERELSNTKQRIGSSSSGESEVAQLELGPIYHDIKQKLQASKNRAEKTFYSHLKYYFGRNMRDGGCLSHSDFNKIKHFVTRFESNVNLLGDKGNDRTDICVYEGFIKLIIKECEQELTITE